jgi:hypothetical protein
MALFAAKTAPCPYCYALIDPSKCWYQCVGAPAPGRDACEKKTDARRVSVLDNPDGVYPSFAPGGDKQSDGRALCPDCKGPSGRRVCVNCHSVLPREFTSDSQLFGMVGARGAGKTVMLTVLSRELQTTVAKRFGAAIDALDAGASPLLITLEAKRKEMEAGSANLPAQTANSKAATRDPAVFSLAHSAKNTLGITRPVATLFSFLDTAGENLGTAESTRDVHYLAATSGVLLLLNPFAFEANKARGLQRGLDPRDLETEPRTVLRNITDVMREAENLKVTKKIKKPVAVVLGMIDAFFGEVSPDSPIRRPSPREAWFDEAESVEVHEYVAGLVAKWGGDDILRNLDQSFENYRFFVASALGSEPDYRTHMTSSRGIQPHRVAEPLLWMMARRALITVKKG